MINTVTDTVFASNNARIYCTRCCTFSGRLYRSFNGTPVTDCRCSPTISITMADHNIYLVRHQRSLDARN